MKILHTSDWHIGQRLYGNDRHDEHRMFFDWLLQFIRTEKVDALLVCGDIFDMAYPSNQALRSYYQLLREISETSCRQIIITGGNHDSVGTLEAPREVLQVLNVTIVAGVPANQQDEIIELHDKDGKLQAVVGAVPFLRDRDIRIPVAGESTNERIEAVRQGILNHYHQLAELMLPYREQNIPQIVTGHLYMQGSQLSESERDLQLGNQAGVSAAAFPIAFDYYALGHIHRPQTISKSPVVEYCGSPLPLSFSEQNDNKLMRLLTVENGKLSHQKIPIPLFREVKTIRGSFAEISRKISNYECASALPAWLEVCIEELHADPILLRAADDFVEQINTEKENLRIIRHTVTFTDRTLPAYLTGDDQRTLDELRETEVFDQLLDQQGIEDREELKHTFDELLEIVHQSDNEREEIKLD